MENWALALNWLNASMPGLAGAKRWRFTGSTTIKKHPRTSFQWPVVGAESACKRAPHNNNVSRPI